jgi:hypothetical protein
VGKDLEQGGYGMFQSVIVARETEIPAKILILIARDSKHGYLSLPAGYSLPILQS